MVEEDYDDEEDEEEVSLENDDAEYRNAPLEPKVVERRGRPRKNPAPAAAPAKPTNEKGRWQVVQQPEVYGCFNPRIKQVIAEAPTEMSYLVQMITRIAQDVDEIKKGLN